MEWVSAEASVKVAVKAGEISDATSASIAAEATISSEDDLEGIGGVLGISFPPAMTFLADVVLSSSCRTLGLIIESPLAAFLFRTV